MRIVVYPADIGGCGHYRTIWPAHAVAEQTVGAMEIEVFEPTETDTPRIMAKLQDTPYGPVVRDVEPINADVVVLQRPLKADLATISPPSTRRTRRGSRCRAGIATTTTFSRRVPWPTWLR
jgi:hypothetical protein